MCNLIQILEEQLTRPLAYFIDEDSPLIAAPTIGQNVTVSQIAALHVPCKETVGSEECIN